METYITKGTCSTQITFNVLEDLTVSDVVFKNGCRGNLQAVARLVDGKPVDEVIDTLKGIRCRSNTSCGDQLALALIDYKEKLNNPELNKRK